jgi:AraC-like DNA-binding protein
MVTLMTPKDTYWTSHPHGLDRGCRIRLAPEPVMEALEALHPRLADRLHGENRCAPVGRLCTPGTLLDLSTLMVRTTRGAAPEVLLFEELALDLLDGLLQPLSRQKRLPSRPDTLEQQRHWVREAQLLLGRRHAEDLQIADIARAVHTSAFHLSRIFKRETGITLHQYRNRIRLSVGLDRLLQGETDLTHLALDLGYSSHSHFTRAFSAEYGLPPSEARRLPVRKPPGML